MHIPRLVISGLSGGAGKTMLSLGLARAFARQGMDVRAFKKGPDYIDAAWLAKAAKSRQGTLDPFFMPGLELADFFIREAAGCDLALIEGNRGLFDGLDIDGSCSTAEVARVLGAPVLLVLDCTKMTRTVAAVVHGCLDFEKGVRIGGVILNRTGNERHRTLVWRSVEELIGIPVLGALPRRREPFIGERHMGLAGPGDHDCADAKLDDLADFVSEHVDIAGVLALADKTLEMQSDPEPDHKPDSRAVVPPCPAPGRTIRSRIGYVRDAAFWFYYRENLEALERAGARLLPVSLLEPGEWPSLDGLYMGGGLPELHAARLSDNTAARARVANLVEDGLPVYAECGGFMYLARRIIFQGRSYPMAGVFNLDVEFCQRPQGLGYVEAEVVLPSPYHPIGSRFRGHEFHFSRPVNADIDFGRACHLRLHRGAGMAAGSDALRLDGLMTGNCFASYTHLFAPAVAHWAEAFAALCRKR